MFAAAFAGAMEYVAGAAGAPRALDAAETQCAAEGAACCRFEVKARNDGGG
jgi:predicted hydrocarbon binding protein